MKRPLNQSPLEIPFWRKSKKGEVSKPNRRPIDGQKIAFRMHGYKSYYAGTWNHKLQSVHCGQSTIAVMYLRGWYPTD